MEWSVVGREIQIYGGVGKVVHGGRDIGGSLSVDMRPYGCFIGICGTRQGMMFYQHSVTLGNVSLVMIPTFFMARPTTSPSTSLNGISSMSRQVRDATLSARKDAASIPT